MKYCKFYIIFGLIISLDLMTGAQNYIVTSTPTDIVTSLTPSRNGNENCITTIQYYNGLGYPSQAVQVGITPQKRNLYTFTDYIGIDLVCKNYLPVYSSTNEELPPASYKKQTEATYNKDRHPCTETISELADPHRPLSVQSPGDAWQGHPTTYTYTTNSASEVKRFYIDASNNLIRNGNYPAASLHKTTTIDPDGHQIDTYTDLTGKTIMTKKANSNNFCTYYIYDELQRLRYVMPPLLASKISSTITNPENNANIKQYAYIYKYDNRGNMIYKKLPGADPVYMVYDQTNKLVLMQDGNMRTKNQWIYTDYDQYNRPLYTCLITYYAPHHVCQSEYANKTVSNSYASYYTSYNSLYFTQLPTTAELNYLTTEYYYDDYRFVHDWMMKMRTSVVYRALEFQTTVLQNSYAKETSSVGRLTGEAIRCQVGPNSYTTLIKAYYYDDKGNVIQTKQNNILGGYEMHYTQYNFSNTVKQETHITTDKNLQPIYTEIYDYTYDHANRLTAVNYRCGKNAENNIRLYTNSYDELGRLTKQQFYDDKAFASYQYDIHNNPTLIKNVNFTQDINYTGDPQNTSGKLIPKSSGYLSWNSQRYYNDNVSATRTNSQNQTNFLYDKSNRLIESYTHTTTNKNSLLWNQTSNTNTYNERFAYDNNGNITKIARTNARGEQIDNLNIQYTGNQIRTITDYAGSKNAKQTKEYQDYVTNSEFTYDANGNLTRDLDRNILSIEYNVLNLPYKITFTNGNMIENFYDADATKYKSVISTKKTTTSIARVNGRYQRVSRVSYSTLSRYYIGNKEYTQTDDGAITLTRVHNAIGYVVPSSDNKAVSGWYHYAKDYLGNVREVYRVNPNDSRALSLQRYAGVMGSSNAVTTARLASQVQQLCCTLVQSMNYYPSGLPLDNCTNSDEQPYKYTGKEYVEEHGLDEYDNGARWYYPALARTSTLDPHCESYYDVSPYSWCGNNFVNVMDPDGRDWYERDEGYWDVNFLSSTYGQYVHNKSIEWTDAKSQLELGDKGRYLGADVLVGTHNRDENLYEAPNTAQFDLYLSTNKEGPVATIMGNTVPADVNTMGTMQEGLYTAKYQMYKGKPALLINEGKPIPTVNGGNEDNPLNHIGNIDSNPLKPVNEHVMDGVYFHFGNNYGTSLRCNNGYQYWSKGCQTGGNYKGSWNDYLKFMDNVLTTFNGSYYLRGK